MGDSRRESMRDFLVKWGICEEKTGDFQVKCRILKEIMCDFRLMGDLQKENG